MPIIFFLIFIIPKILISDVLNLICTNNYIDVKSLDVKDLFVIIDKDSGSGVVPYLPLQELKSGTN